MQKQISSKITALSFGILALAFLVAFYATAWQEPVQAPPGGNAAVPLNVSDIGQIKTGALTVGALGISGTGNALLVPNGNVGIGTLAPVAMLDVEGRIYSKELNINERLYLGGKPFAQYNSFNNNFDVGDWLIDGQHTRLFLSGYSPSGGFSTITLGEEILINGPMVFSSTAPLKLAVVNGPIWPCEEGRIFYNAILKEPCFCDGSGWKQFDGGGNCQ